MHKVLFINQPKFKLKINLKSSLKIPNVMKISLSMGLMKVKEHEDCELKTASWNFYIHLKLIIKNSLLMSLLSFISDSK